MKQEILDFSKDTTTELLDLIGIKGNVLVESAKNTGDSEEVVLVNIDSSDETGLLIGAHGMTLNAIQSFLRMAIRQKTGEWVGLTVNIGDWKEKQEQHLVELAESTAARAISTNAPQRLYNLTPSQRRVIHLNLSQRGDVITESQGEGVERYLVISPKTSGE